MILEKREQDGDDEGSDKLFFSANLFCGYLC